MSDLIACLWTGTAFEPRTPFQRRLASERFGSGEVVYVQAEHERNMSRHRACFARIRDLWQTLPERYALEQWAQSPEHLRKYALISTGYCDTHTLACKTKTAAIAAAAFMRPIDEFSVVVAKGTTVVRYVAKSQSVAAMGAPVFRASMEAVETFIERLIEEAGQEAPTRGGGRAA